MNSHYAKAIHWLAENKGFYIGGEWVHRPNGKDFSVIDPATEAHVGTLPEADGTIVDGVVDAARRAFDTVGSDSWRESSRRQRSEALLKIAGLIRQHADELAAIETVTNGKTFRESREDDIPEAAAVLDYYAGWTDKHYGESVPVDPPFVNYTVHEPLGVVALIVPWNFPLLLGCWKLAPALAMGNTVIVKPASNTSHSMIRLFELIHAARILPPGVINLIYGDHIPGEALCRHPGVDKVSFTGSTAVGKNVVLGAGQSNLKSITLELGGKSPNIIFDDAKDLESVIQRSFTAMFSHKGEKCSEPTRFLIQESIYAQVAHRLVELARHVKCGDPFDPATNQGAQANKKHFEKILSYIVKGQEEGARLLVGGKDARAQNGGRGFFIPPTIFGEVKNKMSIARDEIFGPVLCLIKFRTEDEAIAIANDTPYGLAAGIYSSDASRCLRMSRRLDAGMVFVNHYGCYDFASPFGGVKQSGWGKEMALHSLAAYTKTKSIWMKY